MTPAEVRSKLVAELTEIFRNADGDGGPLLTTEEARTLAVGATAHLSSGEYLIANGYIRKVQEVDFQDLFDEGRSYMVFTDSDEDDED